MFLLLAICLFLELFPVGTVLDVANFDEESLDGLLALEDLLIIPDVPNS